MLLKYKKNNQKRKADNLSASTAMWELLSAHSDQEKGTVLVVALGIGFLLTFIMLQNLFSSSQNKINTAAQESKTRAMEIAEGAVNRYIALINENRAIATYCANPSSDPACNTGTTWSNMTATVIGACSSGVSTIQAVIDEIQNASSTTNWQSLGSDGEYKLVSYIYQPDAGVGLNESPGTGILTLEGRRSGINDAVSRLTVEIPISLVPGSGSTSVAGSTSVVGLWSYDFINGGVTGSAEIKADVKDGSQWCYDSDNDGSPDDPPTGTPFDTSNLQNLTDPPFTGASMGTSTPIPERFPELPNSGVYNPPTGNVNELASCLVHDSGSHMIFPRNDDVDTDGKVYGSESLPPPNNATYIYHINCGGDAFFLSGDGDVIWGQTGQETIYVYTHGEFLLSGNGTLRPYINGTNVTKVVWYVNNNLTLSGSGLTYNPKYFQFYVYGNRNINLLGSDDLTAFIFAPQSYTLHSGNGNFIGALWTESFESSGGGGIRQTLTEADLADLEVSTSNKLNPVSSWRRMSR